MMQTLFLAASALAVALYGASPSLAAAAAAAAATSVASPSLAAATTTSVVDFIPPYVGGGYQLASPGDGYGQPLNIIISSKSEPAVLQEQGFLFWTKSMGLSEGCLDISSGNDFSANLGDGRGWVNQTLHLTGSCFQSFTGGAHLRVFPQTTGAIFIAAVFEDSNQNPITNGYDLSRDLIVDTAVNGTQLDGVKFNVTVEDLTGLLNSGTVMNGSVTLDHGVSTDGVVKLLTIAYSS